MSTEKAAEKKARKGDRAADLAFSIRQAIITGEFEPGSPLRQEELAKTYNASRMPVREALRMLNAEGLIRIYPNRSAVVAPIDALELRENYEMREAAERLAVKLAIPQLSNAQIDAAALIQEQIDACEPGAFGALNKQFHQTLYQPCQRPRLLAHISGLHDIAERYLRFTIAKLGYTELSAREHRDLLEACYQRDLERALAITSAHIVEAGRTLERFLSGGAPDKDNGLL